MTSPSDESHTDKQSPQRISGSCLCGASRYTVSNQPITQVICHCLSCKKWSGSAFGANVRFPRLDFAVDDTASAKYADSNTDSGRTLEHYFCGICGCSMYTTPAHVPDIVSIASGMLDGNVDEVLSATEEERLKGMSPQAEVYCKRKALWVRVAASTQRHQELARQPTTHPSE